MISLQEVRKVYNQGQGSEFVALRGVSLTIARGEAVAFTGPSGSGKTTLLSLVGCMARPTSGRILLDGREMTSLPERFLTEVRRQTFGFIFQQVHLIKGLTALENVMLPAYPSGLRHAVLKKRALALLEQCNLADRADARVEWFSGGEAQRTAIARALINEPAVVIADEPTAHLDTALSREFMAIMHRLKNEGKTLLIASHDPLAYGSEVIDRVVALRDGLPVAAGSGP